MVTVVWETRLKPEAAAEGLSLTRQIWSDMQVFEGYISHVILVDQDEVGHLLVVSEWENRDIADRLLKEYATAEPVQRILPLLSQPRNRWVCSRDG